MHYLTVKCYFTGTGSFAVNVRKVQTADAIYLQLRILKHFSPGAKGVSNIFESCELTLSKGQIFELAKR